MDSKVINEVVAAITERAITVESAHMLGPWKMVLGGLVLPMLAEADPAVASDPRCAEQMSEYSKDKVLEFFKGHKIVVEKPVVKVVEKVVGGVAARKPTLHATVAALGKFRRLRTVVNAVSRKKNDIPPKGRDAINKWWNLNQKLVPAGECQPIADEINGWNECQPLSAKQVGGWFAWLCTLGQKGYTHREGLIQSAIDRHSYSVRPVYSATLVNLLLAHQAHIKADRTAAKKAKRAMEAEVASTLEAMKTADGTSTIVAAGVTA